LLGALSRRVLRVFFRRVVVAGAERIPRDRPVILVANHVNGLVDPLLLYGPLPVIPRFLGKSTLWKIPGLRTLLDLAGVIPVYRRMDPGVDPAKNLETFARCHEVLAAGGAIALFPEGVSHNEPALQPLKTGAARIALEAEQRFGPLGLRIVPVGLLFDEKHRFRSRALIQVGEPIDPAPELAALEPAAGDEVPEANRQAVRRLTERIDQGLDRVTVSYGSWEEARLLTRAAALYGRPALEVPRGRSLPEELALQQAFVRAYGELREAHPGPVAAAVVAVERYDELLTALGLEDGQVAAFYQPLPVGRFLARSLLRLLIGLPLAVVGTVLNFIPYRLVAIVVRWVAHLPDQQASFKVFPSLALFPATWLGEAALAGWWAHRSGLSVAWAVVLTLFLAPVSGWVALRFHETRARLTREVRAFVVLRSRGEITGELRRRRAEAYRQVSAVAELYEGGP
jgi:1-acyl-sn-glycerol-3-phosphate acyltransferase